MSETGSHDRVLGFAAYGDRASAVGEVHARPYPLIEPPTLIIQLACMAEPGQARDRELVSALSRSVGATVPDASAKHHVIPWNGGSLRWESHTEFSTFLWEGPLPDAENGGVGNPFAGAFAPPGPVVSGVRLEIRRWDEQAERRVGHFERASVCFSRVEGGKAAVASDFRQDGDGLTRMLILDAGLAPARLGLLAQRVIEIETYRVFALLGLPTAQALSPRIRRIEERLTAMTGAMRGDGKRDNQAMLAELTQLAADLEADAAASLYRFGASRAYDGIVGERLQSMGETAVEGYATLGGFLERRLAPAMRTCRSVEDRQERLSQKLDRAATLLRTWVDVELERQNRDLLTSMNRRARVQLRLQQTVEGLSVAAVSYYVVGLIGYLAKGIETRFSVDATIVTALFVPLVVLVVAWLVRRIRRTHAGEST